MSNAHQADLEQQVCGKEYAVCIFQCHKAASTGADVTVRTLLQKLKQTAKHLDQTLDTVSEHLPTVASSVNLTGLELADCIVEFSNLSQEVTGGLKAGARSIQVSEQSLRSGGAALKKAIKDVVWPGFQERARATGGASLMYVAWNANNQDQVFARSLLCASA